MKNRFDEIDYFWEMIEKVHEKDIECSYEEITAELLLLSYMRLNSIKTALFAILGILIGLLICR